MKKAAETLGKWGFYLVVKNLLMSIGILFARIKPI
jgi:hypothetical protein